MAENKDLHRRRVIYFSIFILIIGIAGFFFWRTYKYRLVNKKLDKLVTGKSEGLYRINYENLVIDETQGNISANHIDVLPDSSVFESMKEQHIQPDKLFYIHVPKLSISGVKTPKALLNKEISAHIIRLNDAEIEIRLVKSSQENKTQENKTDVRKNLGAEVYRQLLGSLKSITADSLVLENTTVTLVDMDSKKLRAKAEGLSLRFGGIEIDSLKENDSTQILFSRDLTFHIDKVEMPLTKGNYKLQVADLDFDSRMGVFHTGQIRLKTGMSETEFARSHPFAVDRFDLVVARVDLKGFSRSGLLHQQFLAGSLELEDLSLHIFRDKSVPHDSVDRTHDYPMEAIMNLPIPVYIKKIRIRNSYIEYKEKNEKSDSSGKVAFFHVQATIEQVTNMPEYIRKNNQMLVRFQSDFLNASPFSAQIHMQLNDRRGIFSLDARLGEMDAPVLNVLLKPIALAELDKGKINGLRYHLDATNTRGRGRLSFEYENLSVKLLKKDDNKNKYKTKVLPTLAAGFLVKDSNPQHGKTRLGNVDYTRDIHRSIFNLMWKSLFAAIKQVAM
jgi:hypothetical protein